MASQKIGYVRVSSYEQNTERQLNGLELDRVFEDRVSGKTKNRPQLEDMITFTREGDTVFVHSLDRLARNVDDLRHIVKTIVAKGAKIVFIKESLTFDGQDSPMSNLLLSVMGAFAEFEREMIKDRQREGIALAVEKGLYTGRKPCFDDELVTELQQDLLSGVKKGDLAIKYGVSRQTIYNYEKSFLEAEQAKENGLVKNPFPNSTMEDDECFSCGEMMDGKQFFAEYLDVFYEAECEHCGERFTFQVEG